MKVRADYDITENGIVVFRKGEIYEVIFEYDTVYEMQKKDGAIRCYNKEFFTVMVEEGVD